MIVILRPTNVSQCNENAIAKLLAVIFALFFNPYFQYFEQQFHQYIVEESLI